MPVQIHWYLSLANSSSVQIVMYAPRLALFILRPLSADHQPFTMGWNKQLLNPSVRIRSFSNKLVFISAPSVPTDTVVVVVFSMAWHPSCYLGIDST